MRFYPPINQKTAAKKPAVAVNFSQRRSEGIASRLKQATADRHHLARAEAAAPEPIKSILKSKGDVVSRRMGRLQQLAKER
jgi:hypothetical protein